MAPYISKNEAIFTEILDIKIINCKDCAFYDKTGKWCDLYDTTKSPDGFCDEGSEK